VVVHDRPKVGVVREFLRAIHFLLSPGLAGRAPYTLTLSMSGKGSQVYVCAWSRPSRSTWAENIANACMVSLCKHMGDLQ
jgi:hypothetical protein